MNPQTAFCDRPPEVADRLPTRTHNFFASSAPRVSEMVQISNGEWRRKSPSDLSCSQWQPCSVGLNNLLGSGNCCWCEISCKANIGAQGNRKFDSSAAAIVCKGGPVTVVRSCLSFCTSQVPRVRSLRLMSQSITPQVDYMPVTGSQGGMGQHSTTPQKDNFNWELVKVIMLDLNDGTGTVLPHLDLGKGLEQTNPKHTRHHGLTTLIPTSSHWLECSRSIKLTALLPNSPIKLTALLS